MKLCRRSLDVSKNVIACMPKLCAIFEHKDFTLHVTEFRQGPFYPQRLVTLR